ncbi:MAG: DUF4126 domain-containing protein [Candidatus Omnitrophica bacterium]|nr:DUF4126 domain-containing protein [Candidatus Omnitrophota bacterium]MBU4590340.1 DUF4126 domain-containing protein [Candidatus Omnitrophota bacterium]
MDILSNLGALLGCSWASGVNLYLTIAVLGILDKMNILSLPGDLEAISNPFIIGIAIAMYLVEFFADKIPLVDSAWDSIHTFIRPIGGAALSYMAMADMGPVAQIPAALLSGTIAMDSHLTKATARAAINTSPEPFTNSIASVSEDAMVVGVIWMIVKHPIIAGIAVILFVLFSIWFLKMMFRFVKKIFGRGKKDETDKK